LDQNTIIYCIQQKLEINCDIHISNTIMWHLNQAPDFIFSNNDNIIQRQSQEVILKTKSFELSQILTGNIIPSLSLIVQRYIY
jgi:hypothetical protein